MAFAALEFITPTDISGTYDNTWRSYDCTAIIPSGMTTSGVLLRYKYSAATSARDVGFRRGDSTDTAQWMASTYTSATWEYAAIGLDSADDTFDYALNSGAGTPTVQVVGFFNSSHVKFLQNATAYTPGNGVYADVDISSATGADTAVAGIFQIDSQRSSALKNAWRAKGSSDDIYGTVGYAGSNGGVGLALAKCNGSEVAEFKMDSAFGGACALLVGYFISGITFNDPASDKSTGTTGSWQSTSVTTGAVGAYVEMIHTSNTAGTNYGVTDDNTTDDTYGAGPAYCPMFIPVISSAIEQKIAATTQDLYLRATIDAAAGGGTVYTVDVVDGIYLFDGDQNKQQEKSFLDSILMDWNQQHLIEKILRDQILTNDFEIKENEKTTQDKLLMNSLNYIENEKLFKDSILMNELIFKEMQILGHDNLFLNDLVIKGVEILIRNYLFLYDTATAESLAGVYEIVLTDYILLGDSQTKETQKTLRENLLLADNIIKIMEKYNLEHLMLDTFATKNIDINRYDNLMLNEYLFKEMDLFKMDFTLLDDTDKTFFFRELLIRDNLLNTDSVSSTVYAAILAALVYAKLTTVNYLGVKTYTVGNFLGISHGVNSRVN